MILSLTELESLSKRAARGAGFSWGMAEEAGKATRWLAMHGLPSAHVLAQLLQARAAGLTDQCPLTLGAQIADSNTTTAQVEVRQPLLILPFIAAVAQQSKTTIGITAPGIAASVTFVGNLFVTDENPIADTAPQTVSIAPATPSGQPYTPQSRTTVSARDFAILQEFEMQTFAPATEASRLAGAGAGVSDND